ncbi:hypothetical protein SELMODRAFT_101648 [Selaginella moellendorffii]|uniref:Small ribosomal subunit protein uS19m n=1 Tax=Selaginella moellendorffii TaxID=88036 RepID=D8RUL8_SELML|nr:hypothetical protein SELMODRAFT_101648 [Selaginella moellendorffii]
MSPRSKWKGPFVDEAVKAIVDGAKIYSRRSTILTDFVGFMVQIHNGKTFLGVKITEDMVGHKFGEFACTRKIKNLRKSSGASNQGKGATPGKGGGAKKK